MNLNKRLTQSSLLEDLISRNTSYTFTFQLSFIVPSVSRTTFQSTGVETPEHSYCLVWFGNQANPDLVYQHQLHHLAYFSISFLSPLPTKLLAMGVIYGCCCGVGIQTNKKWCHLFFCVWERKYNPVVHAQPQGYINSLKMTVLCPRLVPLPYVYSIYYIQCRYVLYQRKQLLQYITVQKLIATNCNWFLNGF